MQRNLRRRDASDTLLLRREAGEWLRNRREACGLSQRRLADAVGSDYYTVVSQLEMGCGRIPQDKYRLWAAALGMDARDFVLALLSYYDPITYDILFPSNDSDGAFE